MERLIAEHGADAKLPDLLMTIANCEKARSVSTYDRCSPRYERTLGGETSRMRSRELSSKQHMDKGLIYLRRGGYCTRCAEPFGSLLEAGGEIGRLPGHDLLFCGALAEQVAHHHKTGGMSISAEI